LAASWVSNALNNLQFTYEAGTVVTLIENYMIEKMLELMEMEFSVLAVHRLICMG
jgi:hypothetical protein